MNLWEKMTGRDMTKEFKAFELRVKELPADYRAAWATIQENLWAHSDFTGRNLMPIFDGVLGLLETSAADARASLRFWVRTLRASAQRLPAKNGQSLTATSGASSLTIT